MTATSTYNIQCACVLFRTAHNDRVTDDRDIVSRAFLTVHDKLRTALNDSDRESSASKVNRSGTG